MGSSGFNSSFVFFFSILLVKSAERDKLKQAVSSEARVFGRTQNVLSFPFVPFRFHPHTHTPQNTLNILSKDRLTIFSNFYIFKFCTLALLHRVADMASSKRVSCMSAAVVSATFPSRDGAPVGICILPPRPFIIDVCR